MDIEVAISLVDKLIHQKENQHLSNIQVNLLRGVWLNHSYEEIASACYCSVSYVKMIGAKFWQELSQILAEKVTKKTVRSILECYHQDCQTHKLTSKKVYTQTKNSGKRANHTKINPSSPKLDYWFTSQMLFRLTERLDHSLETISPTSQADLLKIKSFSQKLQLIHHLTNKNYTLNRISVDIIHFCRNLINDIKVQFPHRTINLSLFEDPIFPHYDVTLSTLIDEKLVQNILTNLLANALQYSPTESTVTLDIDVEDQKGIFTVIDEGIGLPPDELEQIFQPFYCATNTYQESGDGLGLTIVEKSVRLLQGEIFLSSQIQQGSIFTVVFPIV